LLCGIGPEHIKLLCENTFQGGLGYTLEYVGTMTLDQIIFMFTQSSKVKKTDNVITPAMVGPDGEIKGRDAEGNPFVAKFGGKSLAQKIRGGEVIIDKDGKVVPAEQPKPPEPKRKRKR
jgi:hypothetical protein